MLTVIQLARDSWRPKGSPIHPPVEAMGPCVACGVDRARCEHSTNDRIAHLGLTLEEGRHYAKRVIRSGRVLFEGNCYQVEAWIALGGYL